MIFGGQNGRKHIIRGFFYYFEVVKFPQKHPIFTFGVVKIPHMIGLRPFCAPEFIQLYKNLIFFLFTGYNQILLTLSHLSKKPYGIKGGNSLEESSLTFLLGTGVPVGVDIL